MYTYVVTNNTMVSEKLDGIMEVYLFPECDAMQILIKARDRIHLGDKLVAHPMAGRIRPNESPYKTVLLERHQGELDIMSFTVIEDSIAMVKKYIEGGMPIHYGEVLDDLAMIDWELLKSALDEMS